MSIKYQYDVKRWDWCLNNRFKGICAIHKELIITLTMLIWYLKINTIKGQEKNSICSETDIHIYTHTYVILIDALSITEVSNEKKPIQYVKLTSQLSYKTILTKKDQHTAGKWLIHSTKKLHWQSIAKPGTPQYNILAENMNLIQMNSIVTSSLHYSNRRLRGIDFFSA